MFSTLLSFFQKLLFSSTESNLQPIVSDLPPVECEENEDAEKMNEYYIESNTKTKKIVHLDPLVAKLQSSNLTNDKNIKTVKIKV